MSTETPAILIGDQGDHEPALQGRELCEPERGNSLQSKLYEYIT